MNGATLIQLVSACVGIVGSLFFAIGVMRQSDEAMAKLSGTYLEWNPHMLTALAKQKADYIFGGGLILLAFVLQLVSFFVPATPWLTPSQSSAAPWVAGACTVTVFLLLRTAARVLASRFERQVNTLLRQGLKGQD